MLLIIITSLLGAAPDSDCRSGLIAPELRTLAPTRETYPTAKLERPLVLPRLSGSVWTSGALIVNTSATGTFYQGAATLGGAFSPACNVEIGVDSVHAFSPFQPFNTTSLYVSVSLIEQLALSAGADVRPWPIAGDFRSMRFWLGAPVRWKIAPWFGVVGFERLLNVDVSWSAATAGAGLSLTAPLGVLFQPHRVFAIELHARPYFVVVPRASALVSFDVELLLSPVRWFDLKLAGLVAPTSGRVQVTTQLGAAFRF